MILIANFVENIIIKILVVLLSLRLALLFQVYHAVVVLAIQRKLDTSLHFVLVRGLSD